MAKKLNLSHSSISTYKSCPYKYYLDKVKKIRSATYKSSFLFGSAIDSAVEYYLKEENVSGAKVEFITQMMSFELNGSKYSVVDNIDLLDFSSQDLQLELISDETIGLILLNLDIEELDVSEFLDYYKDNKGNVEKEERLLYKNLAHSSLITKGEMLLEKFIEWIDENVAEVHSTQKYVEIENEEGDKLRGYLDAVVTLNSGKKVVLDFKTSSDAARHYAEGCVEESQQLAIYAQEEGLDDAAYLAGCKNIRKREPRVRLHYVEGKITEEFLDEVFESIDDVLHEIREGKFPKNKDSCFEYGRCQYYDYCHKGKSMKGLVDLNKKDEEI